MRLDLLGAHRLRRLGAAAHNVADAQHLVNLLDLVRAIDAQLLDRVRNLANRHPLHLAFDAARLSKHRPVVHGDQLILGCLLQDTADAVAGALVVSAHDLRGLGQVLDACVDLVQLSELVLRHDVISTRHQGRGRQVRHQRLAAGEESIKA